MWSISINLFISFMIAAVGLAFLILLLEDTVGQYALILSSDDA